MNENNFEKPKYKIKFVKIFRDSIGNDCLCCRYVNTENFYVIGFVKNNGEFSYNEKTYGKNGYYNMEDNSGDYIIYNAIKIKFHGNNNFIKIVNICYFKSDTYARYKFHNIKYTNQFIQKIITNFESDDNIYSRYDPKTKIYCFYGVNKENYSNLIDENVKNINIKEIKNEFYNAIYNHIEPKKTFKIINSTAKVINFKKNKNCIICNIVKNL
jgi:hypothetical protein